MTRARLPLALITTLALLAGCSTSVAGVPAADPAPAPTEGPGSDPVAWVDRVCGGVLAFATPAASPPDLGTSPDLAALKSAFSAYLGSVVAGAERSAGQLGAVGRSPVAGGDEVVVRAKDAMVKLQQDFTAAKATVDAANPADPDAFVAALDRVQATLNAVTAPDALTGIVALPRLGPAVERAGQCRALSALAAAPR
jgi:hypothetical protein